ALALAVLAGLSSTASAEIALDVIGGSEVTFEGLIQGDFNWYYKDGANPLIAGTDVIDGKNSDNELRRAEIIFKGKGPGQWEWVAGYDAKADKFLDVNLKYKFSGFTNLTVGQFKQPNSMEELSSTRFNDFISKAMTTNLQGVARRTGAQIATGGDSWTLSASYMDRELTRNLANGKGFGARGTWAPMHESGDILHLGLSAVSFEAKDATADGRAIFRVRPDADLANTRLISSGQFVDADQITTFGGEFAWVNGPVKLQAEAMTTNVTRKLNPDYGFESWYVSGLWNISGETWGYKAGNLATTLPEDPSKGMWQVGLRYDTADLNDGLVTGGKESNWTAGVNYYWRSNFKFALNYVMVNSEKRASIAAPLLQNDPNILEFRAQVYW
ncbi:MAG: OprO/OprP family phosphate-selective porin, partial [Arenimonas sp.]